MNQLTWFWIREGYYQNQRIYTLQQHLAHSRAFNWTHFDLSPRAQSVTTLREREHGLSSESCGPSCWKEVEVPTLCGEEAWIEALLTRTWLRSNSEKSHRTGPQLRPQTGKGQREGKWKRKTSVPGEILWNCLRTQSKSAPLPKRSKHPTEPAAESRAKLLQMNLK